MKIHEIIRQKRVEKGMTQEQVALALGVSTPAVNKWEKAICYPDITLLPPLARILGTDLNTLLSFQEELSKEEVGTFLDDVYIASKSQGTDAAFWMVQEKLREHPSGCILPLNVAIVLQDIISTATDITEEDHYIAIVEDLLLLAAKGTDPSIVNQAKNMLIQSYLNNNELEKAEEIIKSCPDTAPVNKKAFEAQLELAKGNTERAAEIMERLLISEISDAQSALHFLAGVALDQQRTENAVQLLLTEKQLVSLFNLWDFSVHSTDLQVAIVYKDTDKVLDSLKKMLPGISSEWAPDRTDLYPHVIKKEGGQSYIERVLPKILKELEDPNIEEYDFLRKDERVMAFLKDLKSKLDPS
ncbi:MAG: helix-turn-helix domain-containing protein [Firmicutes bacterium]|nr:helix-turn-helix domain-containing protein [Bacillota bacterium]